jgi:hypothetical protein
MRRTSVITTRIKGTWKEPSPKPTFYFCATFCATYTSSSTRVGLIDKNATKTLFVNVFNIIVKLVETIAKPLKQVK